MSTLDWDIGNSHIVNRACERWLRQRETMTKSQADNRERMDRGREAQAKARRERKQRNESDEPS
jgi:hypothetical protein